MRRLAIAPVLIVAMVSATAAEPEARVTLRDTGYMLGDLIDERIDVSLPDG